MAPPITLTEVKLIVEMNNLNADVAERLENTVKNLWKAEDEVIQLKLLVERLKADIESQRQGRASAEARAEVERLRGLLRELRGYITPAQEQFAPVLGKIDALLNPATPLVTENK